MFPVGSSAMMSPGSFASALAIATRCCSPPESSLGLLRALLPSPTRFIYDFNRKDADGNTRELHTELAKGAIDYTVLPDYRTKYEQVQDRETELVSCPYFTTSLCDLTAPLTLDYAALDSFVVVICVEGKGMIADDSGNEMPIHQGETVLLPATVKSLRVVPEGKLKMLTSCIK